MHGVVPIQITPDLVRAAWTVLPARWKLTVRDKRTATEMDVAGWLLAALGYQTREQFRLYTTTIGTVIYVPFTPGEPHAHYSLAGQLEVLAHEGRHGLDFLAAPIDFVESYGRDPALRTLHESRGYRAGEAVRRRLGFDPSPLDHLAGHLKSYGVSDADIAVSRAFHVSSTATLDQGGVVDQAAADVIAFVSRRDR